MCIERLLMVNKAQFPLHKKVLFPDLVESLTKIDYTLDIFCWNQFTKKYTPIT